MLKGGGNGGRKSTKDKGAGQNGVVMGSTLNINNNKVKTVKSRGDKVFCTYFNSAKGCSKGKDCAFQHVCNVLIAKARAREAKHSASQHTGKVFTG